MLIQAIALDSRRLDGLAAAFAERAVRLEAVLAPAPGSTAAFVIGAHGDPVRAAQRVYSIAPDAPIVLAVAPERLGEIREAVRFAPLVSRHLRCVSTEPLSELAAAVLDAAQAAERRRRTRENLAAAAAQLSARPGLATEPAPVLGRIIEQAPVGVLVLDADGGVEALNSYAVELFETGPVLVGAPLPDWLAEESRIALADALRGALENDATTVLVVKTAGERRILEARVSPLRQAGGRDTVLALFEDVTVRVRAHEVLAQRAEELRAALNEARDANRRKDEFLAMLGHELRNPLAPILTALELMRLRDEGAHVREREVIERHARHMVRLVDDLLDAARVGRGQLELRLEPVDLAEVIAGALELCEPKLHASTHTVEVRAATGLAVLGDVTRLTQVVANLIDNAIKYAPSGPIEIGAWAEEREVVLRVCDDGPGIPEPLRHSVFESFVQAPQSLARRNGGLGLGLAIVRGIVEAHGGSVRLRNETERGTDVEARLPRYLAPDPPLG